MSAESSAQKTYASFYDFYDGPRGRAAQFQMYRELAGEAGSPVLELACGTCMITLELARAGFEPTGLDFSPDMLQVAREKIAREEPEVQARVTLIEGDMRRFRLDRQFSLIFIPSNTFACLTERADQQSCLRSIREHLKPGGLMVIDERLYPPDQLAHLARQWGAVTQHEARINPDTGLYTTYNGVARHVDTASQIIYSRSFIEEVLPDGTVRRYVSEERDRKGHAWWDVRRYFTAPELELLIETAGFTVRDAWGGFDRSPIRPKSGKVIFVAEPA